MPSVVRGQGCKDINNNSLAAYNGHLLSVGEAGGGRARLRDVI